ncbi:helix-turn-helix transcriptional regulator [Myxococcus sp. AB036A]|uniref:helix-turn-helix transcriptional regulator n=1 Tax=Myxococcus sp. AB036A TaxID=2562793 RepID=UPI001E2D4903|nr:helix-turn-helix transcriptional regulator [Myxococcus sp. AB036A]
MFVLEHDFRPDRHRAFTLIAMEGWDGCALSALKGLQESGSASNPAIRSLMERPPTPGHVVTARREELVEDRDWYGAPYVEHYLRPMGLDVAVYSCLWSHSPGVVQGIGIHRGLSGRVFDDADRELMHVFHVECRGMLSPQTPMEDAALDPRLAPRERQTLDLLLWGLGDKQIAAQLGISRFTVNQYTKAIYRRFGVQSRTALIARLLGGDARGQGTTTRLPEQVGEAKQRRRAPTPRARGT